MQRLIGCLSTTLAQTEKGENYSLKMKFSSKAGMYINAPLFHKKTKKNVEFWLLHCTASVAPSELLPETVPEVPDDY